MYYFIKILNLLHVYRYMAVPALFCVLALFAVINWLRNVYRRQNRKLIKCVRAMRSYPHKTANYVHFLPEEYRRQYRAFVNCGTDKPSLVFEFVPKRNGLCALWMVVASAIVCASYIAVFVLVDRNFSYIVMQLVFWLCFALVLLVRLAIIRRNARVAKRIFGQFVSQLARNTPPSNDTLVEDTVRELNKLNAQPVNDEAVGRASRLLNNKGLNFTRTAEEQRKINGALNGLLQAYSQNAGQNHV